MKSSTKEENMQHFQINNKSFNVSIQTKAYHNSKHNCWNLEINRNGKAIFSLKFGLIGAGRINMLEHPSD